MYCVQCLWLIKCLGKNYCFRFTIREDKKISLFHINVQKIKVICFSILDIFHDNVYGLENWSSVRPKCISNQRLLWLAERNLLTRGCLSASKCTGSTEPLVAAPWSPTPTRWCLPKAQLSLVSFLSIQENNKLFSVFQFSTTVPCQ